MDSKASPGRGVSPRRSWLPYLAGVLFLQGCLGAGILAGPLFAGWGAPSAAPRRSPAEQLREWRRTRYDPSRDPPLGSAAPSLALWDDERRAPAQLAAGRRKVIIFLASGST